jgi:hypothetical protein
MINNSYQVIVTFTVRFIFLCCFSVTLGDQRKIYYTIYYVCRDLENNVVPKFTCNFLQGKRGKKTVPSFVTPAAIRDQVDFVKGSVGDP